MTEHVSAVEQERAIARHARKLRQAAAAAELRRNEFARGALTFAQGREFFYWLLSITALKANPFTTNALAMSFNCGQMNVGQQIEGLLTTLSPENYLLMLKEQEDARRELDRAAVTGEPADHGAENDG